jgi:hypothetical protein
MSAPHKAVLPPTAVYPRFRGPPGTHIVDVIGSRRVSSVMRPPDSTFLGADAFIEAYVRLVCRVRSTTLLVRQGRRLRLRLVWTYTFNTEIDGLLKRFCNCDKPAHGLCR